MNKNRKKLTPPLNKPVPTLNLVDYSEMKMPVVVVYDSPLDFPGKVIARVWEASVNRPTNVYCQYETIAQCEKDAMSAGFIMKFPRSLSDDTHIVATYMR